MAETRRNRLSHPRGHDTGRLLFFAFVAWPWCCCIRVGGGGGLRPDVRRRLLLCRAAQALPTIHEPARDDGEGENLRRRRRGLSVLELGRSEIHRAVACKGGGDSGGRVTYLCVELAQVLTFAQVTDEEPVFVGVYGVVRVGAVCYEDVIWVQVSGVAVPLGCC